MGLGAPVGAGVVPIPEDKNVVVWRRRCGAESCDGRDDMVCREKMEGNVPPFSTMQR